MMLKQIPLLLLSGLVLTMASCSRRQYPGENPYPDNRQPYPQRQPGVYYPDRLPPGQAKKVYGDQNARNHTPAHYRKRPRGYRPPLIIIVNEREARCDNRGQWYYHNEYGYRYWKKQDSRFYLDEQYARDNFSDRDDEDDDRDNRDDDRDKRRKHGRHGHRGQHHDD